MTRSTIRVDVPGGEVDGPDEILVEAGFDIEVASKTKGMAVTGIVLFILGFIVLAVMLGFFLAGYPGDWFSTWNGDLDALWTLKERVGIMGLVGGALLLNGMAFYTFGRTYKGEDEVEALAKEAS